MSLPSALMLTDTLITSADHQVPKKNADIKINIETVRIYLYTRR